MRHSSISGQSARAGEKSWLGRGIWTSLGGRRAALLINSILLDAEILTILFIAFHLVKRRVIDLFDGGADNEALAGGRAPR